MTKTKYRCRDCNFTFYQNEVPGRCPYCSKQGVVREEDFFNIDRELKTVR